MKLSELDYENIIMNRSISKTQIGATDVNIKLGIPLSDEIICGNGGSYTRNIAVKCQSNQTCERINSHTYICPDGFSGSRCK